MRAENILENYTAERASRAGRDGERRENARVIPEIYYRPERGADLLLEFRESKWKGVDFRRLDGERPRRDKELARKCTSRREGGEWRKQKNEGKIERKRKGGKREKERGRRKKGE